MEWTLENNPLDVDLEILSEGVTSAGRAISKSEAKPIAYLVRDNGAVVAGVSGRTEFSRLFISYLWVSDDYRGQGIASRLLRELESAATARGCKDAVIETLLDDVAALYQRRGYSALAVIPNYVGQFSRYILRKSLENASFAQ